MRTSGTQSEKLMIIVPVAVAFGLGMLFFGGPAGLMAALDGFVRDTGNFIVNTVEAWL